MDGDKMDWWLDLNIFLWSGVAALFYYRVFFIWD
jgi:hypothetical protein